MVNHYAVFSSSPVNVHEHISKHSATRGGLNSASYTVGLVKREGRFDVMHCWYVSQEVTSR
jgi:hypothetical protein